MIDFEYGARWTMLSQLKKFLRFLNETFPELSKIKSLYNLYQKATQTKNKDIKVDTCTRSKQSIKCYNKAKNPTL